MTLPLIIIRPEPGASRSHAVAAELGLAAYSFPLFAAMPRAWDAPAPDSFDALLLGSANALRHGGPALADYIGKPAYCVGEATTRVAWSRGLIVAATGEGGLQALQDEVAPEHPRLLRLAGAERVPLDPPPGVEIAERVVYASVPVPFPLDLGRVLLASALPALVLLLHSGEAARYFVSETARLGLPRDHITAITIGPRVSDICAQAGGWAAILTAPAATDAAMLALAAQTCQIARNGDVGRSRG